MPARTVRDFIKTNDEARNAAAAGTAMTPAFSEADKERRRQAVQGMKIQPENTHLLRDPPLRASSNSVSQQRKSKLPNVRSTRTLALAEKQKLGVFDDTDVEAGDDTMSSVSRHSPDLYTVQRFRQAKPLGNGSDYGADDDDDDDVPEYDESDADIPFHDIIKGEDHDSHLKHKLEDMQQDGGGDTQPSTFMQSQVSEVIQAYGQRVHGTPQAPRHSRQYSQHDRTPRQAARASRLTMDIPLRVGSAPPETQSNESSPIRSLFSRNSLHQIRADADVETRVEVPDSQTMARHARSPNLVAQRETSHSKATAPAGVDRSTNSRVEAKLTESTFDQTSGYSTESQHNDKVPSKKRSRLADELDYDQTALTTMSFADLHSQSFDFDPRAKAKESPHSLAPDPQTKPKANPTPNSTSNLTIKLSQLSTLTPNETSQFFSSLPLPIYEECGDYFIDQFTLLISRVKSARQERRKAAKMFEDEIAARYERIEGKNGDIDGAMEEMRGAGMGVLRGRTPRKE